MADKKRIAVLISGRGSNLAALIKACENPDYPAEICHVISDKAEAKGLKLAKTAGIPTTILKAKTAQSRQDYDGKLHELLQEIGPDYICLAGFMRILTADFVYQWLGKIVNIHPSLLPKYKGLNTHKRVLENGDEYHGATVHFVTPNLDDGPAIMQVKIPVLKTDDEDTLAKRVLDYEHKIYPYALMHLCHGFVKFDGKQVFIQDTPAPHILTPTNFETYGQPSKTQTTSADLSTDLPVSW